MLLGRVSVVPSGDRVGHADGGLSGRSDRRSCHRPDGLPGASNRALLYWRSGVLCVLFCAPVPDICALAANGDAANPTAINAAMRRLVVVMANPFGSGPSVASAVRESNCSCTEYPYNSTQAGMCRNSAIQDAGHSSRCRDERDATGARWRRRSGVFASVSRCVPVTMRSRAFYPS